MLFFVVVVGGGSGIVEVAPLLMTCSFFSLMASLSVHIVLGDIDGYGSA